MTEPSQSDRPDLKNGIPDGDLADGAMLVGQVGEEQVLLARRGREVFAIGATCTHYGGPLGEGLMVAEALSRQLSTSREGARQIRFMLLLRHLATASPLRLGRSAALIGRRGVVED